MQRLIAALTLVGAAAAGIMGGWKQNEEFGPSSHAHRLASFALTGLKAANLEDAQLRDATMGRVTAWRSQVVSGMNHELEVETSAGKLTLKIYEQVWTGTLKVNSATLAAPVSQISMALFTRTLVDEEGDALELDGAAFNALEASASSAAAAKPEKAECVPNPTPRCTREYRPFCGKNGVNYANRCLANAACQQDATDGPCCTPDSGIVCTAEYAPVCGKDGKTYSNRCRARAMCQREVTEGECAPAEEKKPPVLTTLHSALLLGGAPIANGGGHYASEMGRRDPAATPVATPMPAPQPMMGGLTEQTEFGPTSHVHLLARQAVTGLRARRAFKGEFVRVRSAKTQVVAGTNYRIEAELADGGVLSLTIYEQVWTSTLQVTAASLSAPVSEISMAIATTPLVAEEDAPFALDAAAVAKAEAALAATPMPTPTAAQAAEADAWVKTGVHETPPPQILDPLPPPVVEEHPPPPRRHRHMVGGAMMLGAVFAGVILLRRYGRVSGGAAGMTEGLQRGPKSDAPVAVAVAVARPL